MNLFWLAYDWCCDVLGWVKAFPMVGKGMQVQAVRLARMYGKLWLSQPHVIFEYSSTKWLISEGQIHKNYTIRKEYALSELSEFGAF